jgi:hypothetical protein
MIQLDDRYAEPPPPAVPTTAVAGSPQKIEILRQRAERGESLWHPLDNVKPVYVRSHYCYRSGIREIAEAQLER